MMVWFGFGGEKGVYHRCCCLACVVQNVGKVVVGVVRRRQSCTANKTDGNEGEGRWWLMKPSDNFHSKAGGARVRSRRRQAMTARLIRRDF